MGAIVRQDQPSKLHATNLQGFLCSGAVFIAVLCCSARTFVPFETTIDSKTISDQSGTFLPALGGDLVIMMEWNRGHKTSSDLILPATAVDEMVRGILEVSIFIDRLG